MNLERRRLEELRAFRVRLRKSIEAMQLNPFGTGDFIDRRRTLEALVLTLRGTEPEWRQLDYNLRIEHRLDARPVKLR